MHLIVACTPSRTTTLPTPITPTVLPTLIAHQPLSERIWWRDAVFYEIFVRSFSDSNSDGIGDFNGITQKLDYLKSLGITAIWLMPIHPSPSYHGYDVVNYYTVNPQYGSMDDFKHLVDEAHARNIHIIIDLVLNHTSIQHPWFADALSNPKTKYRDWYVWAPSSSGNKWYQSAVGFYYAYFWEGMPDLNYLNPEVTSQMEKMSSFWLTSVGVDGFRIDAAKHLIEEGKILENSASTHTWLKNYYAFYKTTKPEAYVVGEVGGAGGRIAETYSGQMDQIFNFELAGAIVSSAAGGANSSITSAYKFALKEKPDGNYATFITNHDQNRVMSQMSTNVGKAKVAASLLLTAPGTPYIYYGEEVGLLGKKPDENIRLPMQWTSELGTAGFTNGIPWQLPGKNLADMNVETEDKDPDSLLTHYRTLIGIRNRYHALQTGSLTLLETENPAVFASLRYENQETILVLINLGAKPVFDYKLSLSTPLLTDGIYPGELLFGNGSLTPLKVNGETFMDYRPISELSPYSTTIFLIK
ncbi:MAG: alpha-amylase family glycosyl hydrolase [Chloroflexi bacterium]|nr:alpha-amylase family glycosyl hydrolase [Chloroflexota bacterium]